jgi:membrane protease YdiL (CAAX protease family)
MFFNFLASKDVDVSSAIQTMNDQFGKNISFVILVIPLSLACLFLLFWVKFLHQQSLTSLTTARKKVDWNRVLFSFSLWGSITILMVLFDFYFNKGDYLVQFQVQEFIVFAIIAILLIPLQTSFEEYFFRGYLMQSIGVVTKTRWIPFVFTSISFGLLHAANPEIDKLGLIVLFYYVGTGFFLGMLTLLDEGLELALGFHAANNLIGALIVTTEWGAFQTNSILIDKSEPNLGLELFLPMLVIYPLLLFIFGKKYHWKHWNKKLFKYQ